MARESKSWIKIPFLLAGVIFTRKNHTLVVQNRADCYTNLDRKRVTQMRQDEANIRKFANPTSRSLLRYLRVHGWDKMASELLINLVPTISQLLDLVLCTTRMLIVVPHHFAVAIKAQWNSILDLITTAFALWHQVMNLDVYSASFLAKTTMPVTPE